MKAECLKDKFRLAVGLAEKITGKNLSLPVLSHVHLSVMRDGLKIKATNLDLGIEIQVPAKVEENGQVLLGGAVVANFLSNVGREDKIKLASVNQNLSLTAGRSASLVKTYPVDDFPTIPQVEEGQSFVMSAPLLVGGLKAVYYAAALSDIKPEIASVYLYQESGDLVLVATDSFRLAEKRLVLETKLLLEPKLIIPFKNVLEILRVFEGELQAMTVSFNKNQVAFTTPNIYLTSRLIDSIFPDYRQIVPVGAKTGAVVLKADLLAALKLSSVFSDRLNQVNIKIINKDNLLELNSRNADVGENTTRLEAALQGEDLDVGFNVRYLLDCLPVITSDSISLKFNGANRPILVTGVGDNSFLYLIMPLNR